MSRDDWFRNTQWNDEVAAQFEAKLKRARRKGQYLRIQACTLARREPGVALELLGRYFAQQNERFDDAQAYVDRATALLSLGRVNEALDSYEDALRTEAKLPNMLTQAFVELPYTVSVRGARDRYDRALEVLQNHRKRLMCPVDHFKWNAAQAIIAGTSGNRDMARKFGRVALEFAATTLASAITRTLGWFPMTMPKHCASFEAFVTHNKRIEFAGCARPTRKSDALLLAAHSRRYTARGKAS